MPASQPRESRSAIPADSVLFDDEPRRDLRVGPVPEWIVMDPDGMLRIRKSGWTPEGERNFEKKLAALMGGH